MTAPRYDKIIIVKIDEENQLTTLEKPTGKGAGASTYLEKDQD